MSMLRSVTIKPLNFDFKDEHNALASFERGDQWLLCGEAGVEITTKQMLILRYGKSIYINLRFDNCNKQLRTII